MTTLARPGLETSLLDSACTAVADGVAKGALASAVLAVATSAELVRVEAVGPVATDSIFLIASITKPIFATTIMRLVERGYVGLNEPVASHIPEFAANGKQDVRLWHLLTHTSGLDDVWVDQASGPQRWEWPSVLARTCAAPLRFPPGSRYSYCSPPFLVMADMIRRTTGSDHAEYVRQAVLEPLGMRDTSFTPPNSARVVPVLDPPWRDEQEQHGWIGLHNPGSGLWSTAADLVRFGQMLLQDGELDGYRVLAPATLRAMSTLQTAGVPTITGEGEFLSYYGLGFSKAGPDSQRGPSPELRSPAGFGHGGATGTLLWVEPEFDLVFVFLTNRWGQEDTTLKRALNATIAAASTS
jgi:CubicO group peptidase (beta-lactamase class C family)